MPKGIGGVEQIVAESGRKLGKPFTDFHEAGLALRRQVGAAETEVAELILDDLALCARQSFEFS